MRHILGIALFGAVASALAAAPPLGSARLDGGASNAVFRGGATADGGMSFVSAFAPAETVSVEVEVDVAPEHVGSPGGILVIGTVDGQLFQRRSDGAWVPWSGDPAALQPATGPRTLNARETVTVLDGLPAELFPGRSLQAIVGYQAADGSTPFTWPPVEFAVSGRCAGEPAPGSLTLDAGNGIVVAEVAYRAMSVLSDMSSLVDQAVRATAAGNGAQLSCGVGGGITGTPTGGGVPGRLDSDDRVGLQYNSCVLGGGTLVNGAVTVTANTATGPVSGSFEQDWAYSAEVMFPDLLFATGDTTFTLNGDYTLRSTLFAGSGVQLIDFDTPVFDLRFNGIDLQVTDACHESNAFGAGKVHTEAFRFQLVAAGFGDVGVETAFPLSGPFGGPPVSGRIELLGATGSRVVIDAGACGAAAFDVQIAGPGGAPLTPSPNCIPASRFTD